MNDLSHSRHGQRISVDSVSHPEQPGDLPAADRDYWRKLIVCKAAENWSNADLSMLLKLVKMYVRYDEQSAILDEEGPMIPNRFNQLAANPQYHLCAHMLKQIQSSLYFLHLSPAHQEKSENKSARLKSEGVDEEDDGLIL